MKASIAILFFISAIPLLYGQETELDKRNGFKDIKLGSLADSVKGAKLKKEFQETNGAPAMLYSVEHADYEKVGEVKVLKIELKAYKGLIYEIAVITEKDPRLIKGMEMILGKALYDHVNDRYYWNGQNLRLTYEPHEKKELLLKYVSFPVYKKMKEDKEKKVEDISKDF